MGNRQSASSSLSGVNSGSFTYTVDDETSTDTYDANGNTTTSGGKTFTFDSENHMTSMTGNGKVVTMVYDAFGNRVSKTVNGVTTQYLVEDDVNPTGLPQVVEETVNGAVTRSYTYGLERISEAQPIQGVWTPSFYEYDGAGSVRQLTNAAISVTDTYEYDAFGNAVNKTGTTPNNYLYRGEQYDPTLACTICARATTILPRGASSAWTRLPTRASAATNTPPPIRWTALTQWQRGLHRVRAAAP